MAQLQSLADAPGTLREYETIYILRSNTSNDRVADVNERVRGIIESKGGKILNVDNWGKRRLAYEIRAERKGIYLYWQYLGNAETVKEFERNMRMFDSVLRYMTVKLDKDIDPNARPSDVDDEAFERAANTAADEEDMMLGRGEGESGAGEEESAEGEDKKAAPAEGEDDKKAAPAEGEDDEKAAPAEGEDDEKAASAEGEDDEKAASAEGEDKKAASAEGEGESKDEASDEDKE